LRIIISSATIDAGAFKDFFASGTEVRNGNAKKGEAVTAISLEGRTYPVDVMYLDEPSENYIESALKTIMDIHLKVFIFLARITARNQKEISCYF
jgi:ATP-dependent RNA helicase DDX35